MSQFLTPLNGGGKDTVISNSTRGVFLSKQYVSAFNLNSRPSEWITSGRPIYDRLPSDSQNYRKAFSGDDYEAFVYVPYGESELGRKSLNVISSGDEKEFLVIQSGNVVWRRGTIPVNPTIINLQELGMWNTKYLLSYRLYFDDTPGVFQYEVESFPLTGLDLAVNSSTDEIPGWRYTSDLAFTGLELRPWFSQDPVFPEQGGITFLEWQTPYPCSFSRIVARCPSGSESAGPATLRTLSCDSPHQEGEYCSTYTWNFESTVEPSLDEGGFFYEFSILEPTPQTGWRIDWVNSGVKVYQVSVDGVLSLRRRPEEGVSICELVAFPENAAPEFADLGEGKSVRATYCDLALVDVNKNFQVDQISDLRKIVKTEYTPVADWLTEPWDENLSNLFHEFGNYTKLWMDPVSSMNHEYEKLSRKSIEVR